MIVAAGRVVLGMSAVRHAARNRVRLWAVSCRLDRVGPWVAISGIRISSGGGVGDTALPSFDAALFKAGIGNFNLLPLSSVIPPGATVTEKPPELTNAAWGDGLYVVLAEQTWPRSGRLAAPGRRWSWRHSS